MKNFNVLVVDDDAKVIKAVHDEYPPLETFDGEIGSDSTFGGHVVSDDPVRVWTATSIDEARKHMETTFFHAAFVDIQLKERSQNIDGLTFLKELERFRPSCRRFLLSQHSAEYVEQIAELIHPLHATIQGTVSKYNYRESFLEILKLLAQRWLLFPIEVGGTEEICASLKTKRVGTKDAQLTQSEIDCVISRLMGQDFDAAQKTPEDINRILLKPLQGGRSRSIVALGKPMNVAGQEGIYCVIKIGPIEEMEEEYRRYRKYVRLLVSLNRRVELLEYVSGDTIGAVCYSFAGKSPDKICSLGELFEQQDDAAIGYLRQVFNPEEAEWYAKEQQGRDLARFFNETYKFDAARVLKSVNEFAEQVAPKIAGVKVGNEIILKQDKIGLPQDVLGSGRLRGAYQACIVHGDLNADNIIVSNDKATNDERVIWIDFRYTGWGPRGLDFAPMQASLRLTEPTLSRSLDEIVADHRIEKAIWRAVWHPSKKFDFDKGAYPYWARLSLELGWLLRANFPDLSSEEYAATCLLWALRIFRVTSLTEQAKLRLLIWISALKQQL